MAEDHTTTPSAGGSSEVPVETFSIDDHEQAIPHRSPRLPPRRLKQRHIAGTLGTGLFLGSGQALSGAGPVGALIAYSLVGTVAYSSLCSLGEMTSFAPVPGSFPYYAARWVDPALGFAVGHFWLVVTVPVELSGVQLLTQFYYNGQSDAAGCDAVNNSTNSTPVMQNPTILRPSISYPVTVAAWAASCVINIFGARFVVSNVCTSQLNVLLVCLITGLIIAGLVIDLGGAPTKDRLGFRYWKNPGVFARAHLVEDDIQLDRFLGVMSVIVQAAFSFQGMEIAAIAASETESPRRNVAKAIRKSFFRILFFYILGIFVAGLIVPFDSPLLLQPFQSASTASAIVSPYVIAMKCVSIRVLPQVVNAGLITSAFSAGNSFLFAASRILFGLAVQGQAPAFFLRTTNNGVPIVAVLFTGSFGLLSLMGVSQHPQKVFQWLVNLSTVGDFFSWATINLTYYYFYCGLKQQGRDRKNLQYWSRLQPWLSIWGVFWCTIFILISGFQVFWRFNASDFFSAYINIPIFLGLYLLWKISKKTEMWIPEDMDFDSGIPTLEETELPYRRPNGFWGKFADAVF
ncbi:hypothetical protein SCLCIDRAFT_1209652 [Scleroderma citrinum Foug A]|uniref:Amino acid permease/ SLC12A domain-containing protein n=1 Tax=Scleroderma citrinum Foug A TaxID=1036808 RepID=A0A0C3E636_9AGAM|nr:hypothetical protein SCLCIDRAFT_1209652 [Scleroderma citrinum Foug A]